MSALSEKELRELDAWIAEHVMGFKRGKHGGVPIWRIPGSDDIYFIAEGEPETLADWSPTTCPAAAMEVLKKCAEKLDTFTKRFHITIDFHGGHWYCDCHPYLFEVDGQESLELAICFFSRKLFSK